MRINHLAILTVLLLSGAGAAAAKDKALPPPPQAWQDVVKCREVADPAARLACFDAQVGKLEQAAATGEVVMADRASVRESKKGLFGFKLPSLGIFGGGDDDKDEVKSVEGTIAVARPFGYGNWRITLADGSVWEQTDDERPVFDPAKGDKVKIYKGALGTFKMNIDGQRAIKVRRVE
jgi:hypothetical protein